MAESTKIQWCDHTFNPWRGCTKIAPGCANCYADTQSKRNPGVLGIWGTNGTRVVAAESYWRQPLKWNREAEQSGVRRRVFCASLADVFESWDGPIVDTSGYSPRTCDDCGGWCNDAIAPGVLSCPACGRQSTAHNLTMADVRRRLFRLIDATPHLDWLLVTKRPENVRSMWCSHVNTDGYPPSQLRRPNVWLLTSVSDQETWDKNVPALEACSDLAPVLGVSAEPLLGPIRFTSEGIIPACGDHPNLVGYMVGKDDGKTSLWPTRGEALRRKLKWIIVGGESGADARPCRVDDIRSIVWQCREAEVACFVKQLGACPYGTIADQPHQHNHGMVRGAYTGIPESESQLILRDPKGGDPSEWPADLRVRQFPEAQQ